MTTVTATTTDRVLASADARLDELARYVRPLGVPFLDTLVALDRALAELRDLNVASAIGFIRHARRMTFGSDRHRETEASAIRGRIAYVEGFLAAADVVVSAEAEAVIA